MTVTAHWHELVTVALLGTDRRDPPRPPALLADTVDDALADTPAERLVTAVAATVVARRVGMRPGPPAATLRPPPLDARPLLPTAAAARWAHIVAGWPVLEDEFWLMVHRRRWRVPPDLLAGALRRHRRHAAMWSAVMTAGGPTATWLVEQRPELGRSAGSTTPGPDRDGDGLPSLPVAPELAPVLTAGPADVVAAFSGLMGSGTVTMAYRNVLVNFVARCRRDALVAVADALGQVGDGPVGALALTLADLAICRHEMLVELET
ncbi:MAG: hypothetical protein ACK5OX_03625 [Desertimonas sp.]